MTTAWVTHAATTRTDRAARTVRSSCPCGWTSETHYAQSRSAHNIAVHMELAIAGAHLRIEKELHMKVPITRALTTLSRGKALVEKAAWLATDVERCRDGVDPRLVQPLQDAIDGIVRLREAIEATRTTVSEG